MARKVKRRFKRNEVKKIMQDDAALAAYVEPFVMYPPFLIEEDGDNVIVYGMDAPAAKAAPAKAKPATPTKPVSVDVSILDDSVANIAPKLEGMSEAELKELLEAEEIGKTRKTLVEKIKGWLSA